MLGSVVSCVRKLTPISSVVSQNVIDKSFFVWIKNEKICILSHLRPLCSPWGKAKSSSVHYNIRDVNSRCVYWHSLQCFITLPLSVLRLEVSIFCHFFLISFWWSQRKNKYARKNFNNTMTKFDWLYISDYFKLSSDQLLKQDSFWSLNGLNYGHGQKCYFFRGTNLAGKFTTGGPWVFSYPATLFLGQCNFLCYLFCTGKFF